MESRQRRVLLWGAIAAAVDELDAKLLTVADLPAGYIEAPASGGTVALKVTGTSGGKDVVFDQIFMRRGDVVVLLVRGGPGGVDSAVTDQLARKAAEKVDRRS